MRPKFDKFLFVKAWCCGCGSLQWHVKTTNCKWRCLGCVNRAVTIGEPVAPILE